MKLINRKSLNFELLIESLEDLWVLSQFIAPEDRVFATTERKVKIGENNTKQVRKIIFVVLKVLKTSFQSDTLRVWGEIQNETEFTAIGQAHSLSFNVNDKIKIEKIRVLKFEEKILKRSMESKKSKNLLVLLDKDDLIVTEFTDFNYNVLFEKRGLGSKKGYHSEVDEEEEKFNIIEEYLKRDYSNFVLAGAGHFKDKLAKYVKDKIGLSVLVYSFPDVSASSVSRVIKEINEKGLVLNSNLGFENEVVSKFLENVNKGNKYVYGFLNTSQKVTQGSCEVLIVTTDLISSKRDENAYNELNDLMNTCEKLNGDLVIVNSKNESGKIIDGLGGIGAILRY